VQVFVVKQNILLMLDCTGRPKFITISKILLRFSLVWNKSLDFQLKKYQRVENKNLV